MEDYPGKLDKPVCKYVLMVDFLINIIKQSLEACGFKSYDIHTQHTIVL